MPPFLAAASRAALALALALVALAAVPPTWAQGLPAAMDGLSLAERQTLMAQQARRQALERAAGSLTLEGALDPATYIVGPGDLFSVSFGGALSGETTVQVSADGVLVIPEAGSFPVAGLPLAEARSRVQAGLRRVYRNVATDVVLAQPRQFFVHVSGAVDQPGRHALGPVARVEDAVAAATGGSPLAGGTAALRNVEVRSRDGSRVTVDLRRYYATGDTGYNPPLQDGDVLYVPTLRLHNIVSVEVPLQQPLTLDYRPGDTVEDVLLAAGGPALLSEFGSARLLRTEAGGRIVSEDIALSDVAALRTSVQARDRLLLPEPARRFGTASVDGFVQVPGLYPIEEGVTTLRDLLAAAGGVAPEGLLRAGYLERRGTAWEVDGVPALEAVADPAQRALFIEQASFESARLSDLPFGSRQYMARETLQFQRVSLALGDDETAVPAVPLRRGDRFVVPRDPRAVLVIGQVRSPGFVPVRDGAPAEHYVAEAGGRGPAATQTYVREAGTGYLRPAGGEPLRSGDVVFVDRQVIADTEPLQALALQEQQLAFQRQQDARTARLQLAQIGLTVVSTAVALVTTYLLATRD